MGEDPSRARLNRSLRVLGVVGTRPEAVKLAPLVLAARARDDVEMQLVDSGQHPKEMLEALSSFGLVADVELELHRTGHTLDDITSRCLRRLAATLADERPDVVVVQGDTTTALAAALASFYARIPVAHVEAGLRTYHRYEPFPEEMNRRVIDVVATYLFPPTPTAAAQLDSEGHTGADVFTTGNTIVDALQWLLQRSRTPPAGPVGVFVERDRWRARVLVTAHRRESWGRPLDEVAAALASLGMRFPEVVFLLPLHPNPIVRGSFAGRPQPPNVVMTDSLPYAEFITALEAANLVLTDSGGVLEEATALGVPALILRDRTERPEALEAGARLTGLGHEGIEVAVGEALTSADRVEASDVFGDGRASERIVDWLRWRHGLVARRADPFTPGPAAAQALATATSPNRTVASSS